MPHFPDSNPNNKNNWRVEPLQGTWKTKRTSYFRNSAGQAEEVINEVNHLSGGLQFGESAYNSSGYARNAKSETTVNVTMRMTWIGLGDAPDHMWILKKATADATCQPDGSVTASNGLGGTTVNTYIQQTRRALSSSSKLLRVETTSGYFEQEFSMSATAEGQGFASQYGNTAGTVCSFEIEFKNTDVTTSVGGTYVKGSNGVRKAAPKLETHTVGREYTFPGPGGGYKEWGLYLTFFRQLIGPWFDPYHEWSDGTTFWSDSLISEYDQVNTSYKFGLNIISGIPSSGPQVKTMNLKVSDVDPDEDHTVIPKDHKLYIYAPVMYPTYKRTDPGVQLKVVSDLETEGNQPAYAGAGIACTWHQREVYWDVFEMAGEWTDTTALFSKLAWLSGVCAVLGLTEAMFGPEEASNTAPWAWGSMYPDSTYNMSTTVPNVSSYNGWQMWPKLKQGYRTHWAEADIYDESGFKQSREDSYEQLLPSYYGWSGAFSSYNNGGGGGGGGIQP